MKHPFYHTSAVMLWLIFSVALGMYSAPLALSTFSGELQAINPIYYIIIVVALVLMAAWGWTMMMKKWEPKYVELAFAIGIGLLTSRALSLFINANFISGQEFSAILWRGSTSFLFGYLFWGLVKTMQKSWQAALKLTFLSNIFMTVSIAIAAVIMAIDISPFVALTLLALVAVYDAIAVWKTGHMVEMANYFIKRRALPGIAVPYKNQEGKFAFLGGGDVFFIILVATSFFRYSPFAMYVMAATMVASVFMLFLASRKDTMYPALPFIFGGAMLGMYVLISI